MMRRFLTSNVKGRRWLSSSSSSSGSGSGSVGTEERVRLLLAREDDDEAKKKKTKQMAVVAAGVTLGVGGAATIGYAHLAQIMQLVGVIDPLDAAGVSLLAVKRSMLYLERQ
jgi:hypothetical protein